MVIFLSTQPSCMSELRTQKGPSEPDEPPVVGNPNASREVAVAMGAFDVTVVGPGGEVVAEYARELGDAPTDSADPVFQLRMLAVRPGGWRDSVVRRSLPDELVALLDS